MPPAERAPRTLDQFITLLIQLRARYPGQGSRPVHLLNMDDDGDGLVAEVDLACFDEEQGPVASLLSSSTPDAAKGDSLARWNVSGARDDDRV